MALANKTNECVPFVSLDLYKCSISKEKEKRIEDVGKVVRDCCVDDYLKVDAATVKDEFGEDISTYLVWYYDSIEAAIREVVSSSSRERLSIDNRSTLLWTWTWR